MMDFLVFFSSLALLLSLSQALSHNFSDCAPAPYTCGELTLNITYPFLVDHRSDYCGHPNFLLICENNTNLMISIGINERYFQVRNVDYENYLLSVVDTDFVGQTCPQTFHNTTIDSLLFALDRTDGNLSLYFNCTSPMDIPAFYNIGCLTGLFGRHSYYRLDNQSFVNVYGECESTAVVPLDMEGVKELEEGDGNLTGALQKGFSLEWKPGNGWCSDCMNSGGYCGYDSNNPDDHTCLCSNSTVIGSCSSGLPANFGKRNTIIGVISGTAFLLLACIFLYQCIKRKFHNSIFWKKRTESDRAIEDFLESYGALTPKTYSYSELKRITKSFSDKLGQGGYGTVFKGTLSDGRQVAVKVLSETKGNGEEFINEVASIGRTSHVNIVSLLGYCLEGTKRALVYDFMPNGSLEKYICGEKPDSVSSLSWETLYNIAIGIARGLEYLHRGCNTRIVHFDIKPHNILLDEDFCPKIADFGLAKLCPHKESNLSMVGARGTIGYIAPEVFSRNFGVVSSKSDVYSYGMMVLEMAGGRKKSSTTINKTSEFYFPHWIYEHLDRHGTLQDWGTTVETEEIARKMILVGLWCIQTVPTNRPSIVRVVEMLSGSITNLHLPAKPYLSSSIISAIGSIATSTS